MKCIELEQIIQLLLDNELDAPRAREAQEHLRTCSPCSTLLELYSKQDALLRGSARSEPADHQELRKSIVAAIRDQPSKAYSRSAAPRFLRLVAAVAVIAAVAALLLIRGGLVPGINSRVYAAAAADHADHCTLDRLTAAVTDTEQLDRLVAEYGHRKKMPDLSTFGYSEPRAKVCGMTGGSILHLVYQNSEGKPLSVFMRPHRDQDEIGAQLSVKPETGYRVAAVSRSEVDVLVVTSLDEKQTAAILQAVAAQ